MKKEELYSLNYSKQEYWCRYLLKEMKHLDESLTNYLLKEIYRKDKSSGEEVIEDIKIINDITNFILEKIKKDNMEYSDYYAGSTKNEYDYVKNIHNSWVSMINVKERIEKLYNRKIREVNFDKGFDTGFCSSNFCTINAYIQKKECQNTIYPMFIVTTTNGKKFSFTFTYDYYKEIFPELDETQVYNKKIKEEKSFENLEELNKFDFDLNKITN